MKVCISKWFQVVEYGLAKHMLYLAGCGQRREDGDTLHVFMERPSSFYVRKDAGVSEEARLAVDEGSYTNALHALLEEETESKFSLPWYEYVDACHLMQVLCRKLVPNATFKGSEAIGRGRRQQDMMEQYVAHLLQWSKDNDTHHLKFI